MMKKIRNKINGVLLLNKPFGISSNNTIQKVKYLLNAEKVGHTGTLDPMATGLLPVCLGEATKFANYLLDGDKEYIATAKLGVITDSGDAEGNIVAVNEVHTTLEQILQLLPSFLGKQNQVPPMYSALKFNGKPLYEYARAGITIERPSREIFVHNIELLNYDEVSQIIKFITTVSKGTYIRTLAEDIGNALGCGASLIALERTKTNEFNIDKAITIEDITNTEFKNIQILPVDILCSSLPIFNINDDEFKYVKNGNQVTIRRDLVFKDNIEVRIYYNENFIGVGNISLIDKQIMLHPKRMISLGDASL